MFHVTIIQCFRIAKSNCIKYWNLTITRYKAAAAANSMDRLSKDGIDDTAASMLLNTKSALDRSLAAFPADLAIVKQSLGSLLAVTSSTGQDSKVILRTDGSFLASSKGKTTSTSTKSLTTASGDALSSDLVLGILRNMKESFETRLQDVVTTRAKNIETFNGLKQTKNEEITTETESLNTKQSRLAEMIKLMSDAKGR
jgi:hypothetical protein